MTIWFEVDDEVLEMAQSLIERHHQRLANARIAFVFRDEAQTSGDKEVWGQASKISDKLKPHLEADFLIWLAEDIWKHLAPRQRMALLDHELCHCEYDHIEDKSRIRKHDIEEFFCIIERYGFWRNDLERGAPHFQKALQMKMELGVSQSARVNVFALEPAKVPE